MGSIVDRRHRLFVANIPPFVVADDVRSLMGKVCAVKEVYIPPETVTGLNRGFAIVELDADMSVVRKCLQVFHNTHWKGTRLRVELAKTTFYQDKLAKEKAEAAAAAAEQAERIRRQKEEEEEEERRKEEGEEKAGRERKEKERFSGGSLKIRRSMSRFVQVKIAEGQPPKYLNMKVFPKRVSFDDEGVPVGDYPSMALINSVLNKDSVPGAATGAVGAAGKEQQGKGVKQRVGFGFERKPVLRPGNEDNLCCVETSVNKEKAPKNKIASAVGNLFQGKIEDDLAEFAIVRAGADGEEEDDEDFPAVSLEPAVSAEEVTDAALDAERQRMLSNMQRLFQRKNGDAPPAGTEGGDGTEQTPSAAASATEPVKRVRAPIAKGLSAWNSIAIERYDPTGEDAVKHNGDVNSTMMPSTQGGANTSLSTGGNDESTDNNFANLDVLKGIFQKESGGVQFASGGLKQDGAVVGQRSAEDTLFLEAEKWGFDVRLDDNKAAAAAEGAAGTQSMSFNFFGDTDATSGSAPTGTLPSSLASAFSGAGAVSELALTPSVAVVAPAQPLPIFAPVAVGLLAEDAPRIAALSMTDIITEALKFRRQITPTEVHDRWMKNRDKLTIDYKRKRKESRKKAALAGGKKLKTEDLIAAATIGNSNSNSGGGNKKFGNRNGAKNFNKKRGGKK